MRLTVTAGLTTSVLAAACLAQSPPAVPVYAITGARVEVGDGTVRERATVVLRDGRIEAVGPEVPAPVGAEVIPGEGLVVYPGFIDAHAQRGLRLPEWQPNQDVPPNYAVDAPASMRIANRKGIRPELRGVEWLAPTDATLVPDRQGGFTTALLAPSGGTMDGTSVLVDLSGAPRRESVVRTDVAQHFAFRTTGTGYPGSLLGIFALTRQTLLDAQRARALQVGFEKGKLGRPAADPTIEALQPALKGQLPVVVEADTQNQVARSLALAEEFGLRPVISGGLEAYKAAPTLAAKQVPVIVGLAFGAEPRLPREGQEVDPTDTPPAAARERRRLWEERTASAGRLSQAGVPIAFTTRGTRNHAEFWTNLRQAIRAGLPREAALKGLTGGAARLFGVERQLGTVEPGKTANLTLLTADFASADAKVKYLFIDGRRFEPAKERVPPAQPAPLMPAATPREEDHAHADAHPENR